MVFYYNKLKDPLHDCNGFMYESYLCTFSCINKNGGGRGIRTPAGFDPPVGFQDRSLQPDLGIPPYQH